MGRHWNKPVESRFMTELDELTELCQDPGNLIFTIDHKSEAMFTKAARDDNQGEDESMEGVPAEYAEFRDVFSGVKADTLPPH